MLFRLFVFCCASVLLIDHQARTLAQNYFPQQQFQPIQPQAGYIYPVIQGEQFSTGWNSPYQGNTLLPGHHPFPTQTHGQPGFHQPNIVQPIYPQQIHPFPNYQQHGFAQPNVVPPNVVQPTVVQPNGMLVPSNNQFNGVQPFAAQPLIQRTITKRPITEPSTVPPETIRPSASRTIFQPKKTTGTGSPNENSVQPGIQTKPWFDPLGRVWESISELDPASKNNSVEPKPVEPNFFAPNEPAETVPSLATKSLPVKTFPTSIGDLIAIDEKIEETLPKILPAVVAIEGGSGVIVSESGYILTASHVTKKANRTVDVRLPDGRTVRAITLGTNANTDTAALKILEPGPWPFIPTGDSTLTETGDWCLALGYPLSYKRGEPAAARVGRILKISKGPEERLITDCPITGGDSGGPLVNLNGTLIGISSRIKNDINQNIHVPIQSFQDDWQKLANSIDTPRMKTGTKKQHAYLGILGETDNDKVRIRRVIQGSPAAVAGMLKEDVILQMDGKPIGKFDDVLEILTIRKPGEQVVTKLNRFGSLMVVAVKLGSQGGK